LRSKFLDLEPPSQFITSLGSVADCQKCAADKLFRLLAAFNEKQERTANLWETIADLRQKLSSLKSQPRTTLISIGDEIDDMLRIAA